MKHKKLFLAFVLLSILLWPLCARLWNGGSQGLEIKDIPYLEAKNYFYSGGAGRLADPKICTDAQFDSLFDTASHLDESNQPTPVDFSRQFVIAVVLPVTNRSQSVRLGRLAERRSQLVLSYKLLNGPVSSRKIRPVALVLVDRRYVSHDITLVEE